MNATTNKPTTSTTTYAVRFTLPNGTIRNSTIECPNAWNKTEVAMKAFEGSGLPSGTKTDLMIVNWNDQNRIATVVDDDGVRRVAMVHAGRILTTNQIVFAAWERIGDRSPYDTHQTTMTFGGITYGRVGSRRLPAELEALPAMTKERSEAVQKWLDREYSVAYDVIREAFFDASLDTIPSRRQNGDIVVDLFDIPFACREGSAIMVIQDGASFIDDKTGDELFASSVIVRQGDTDAAMSARLEFYDWAKRQGVFVKMF